MGYLEWTEELSVHIEEIDSQHKEFISIINELHESLKTGRGDDVLGEILSQLTEYAVIHFVTEERLMKRYGYHDLENHKSEHIEFKKHIAELHKRFISNECVSAGAVVKFIKDWLTKHIKMTDMKYAFFLKDKNISVS